MLPFFHCLLYVVWGLSSCLVLTWKFSNYHCHFLEIKYFDDKKYISLGDNFTNPFRVAVLKKHQGKYLFDNFIQILVQRILYFVTICLKDSLSCSTECSHLYSDCGGGIVLAPLSTQGRMDVTHGLKCEM